MYHSLFGNGSGKKRAAEIKKHTVIIKSTATSGPGTESSAAPLLRAVKAGNTTAWRPSAQSFIKHDRIGKSRNRNIRPATDFGGEDSDNEENSDSFQKRRRRETSYDPDLARKIRCTEAFQNQDTENFRMLHAADIPTNDKLTKYEPSIPGLPMDFEIELQYPSVSRRERYV